MTSRAATPAWLDLLALATRPAPDTDAVAAACARVENWTTLRTLARRHGMLRPVAALLRDASATLPPQEQAAWQGDLQREGLNALRLAGTASHLHRAFEEADVPALFLKGPGLAALAYGDATARTSADLDVLTDPTNVAAARSVLHELGFRPTGEDAATRRWERYHESYKSSAGGKVELHWATATPWSPWRLSTRDWWQDRHHAKVGAWSVPVPPPDRLLVYLALHGLKHYWTRLGWVRDIAALTSRDDVIDWAAVGLHARRAGLQRPLGIALALSRRVSEVPTPGPVAALANTRAATDIARTFFERLGEHATLGAERWTELQLFLRSFDSPTRRLNRIAHIAVGRATGPIGALLNHTRTGVVGHDLAPHQLP